MMTDEHDMNDDLDDLFATARRQTPLPTPELLARVAADARRVQDDLLASPRPPVQRNRVAEFFRELGGWPAVAGMCTATVAGVWFGINPPENLLNVAQDYMGSGIGEFVVDAVPETYMGFAEEAS